MMMIDTTLEPPGRIAILGADLAGLEAALYARFLGYDVVVLDPGLIGQSWRRAGAQPLPFLPGRGLSPLAQRALATQAGLREHELVLPTTCESWGDQVVQGLAMVDLLTDRILRCRQVQSLVPVVNDLAEDICDFVITCVVEKTADAAAVVQVGRGPTVTREGSADQSESWQVEAIIDTLPLAADLWHHTLDLSPRNWADDDTKGPTELSDLASPFCQTDYLFRVSAADPGGQRLPTETEIATVLRQIRVIFAVLGGRRELDLYRTGRL